MPTTAQLVRQLATARQRRATEATIQSVVHHVLADPALSLGRITLEHPLPGGRRADLLAEGLVVETKRDLRPAGVLARATEQVCGYIRDLNVTTRRDHLGIVTDGAQWYAYRLHEHTVRLVGRHTVRGAAPEHEAHRLLTWLNHMRTHTRQQAPTEPPPGQLIVRMLLTASAGVGLVLVLHALLSALR